ncbi:MAG: hypothetical protein LBS07_05820 [Prevotellaceae bacterium]|jgi:hypothetical protein|nr:hypothetical protein [Prevotellaceae bacterium]
MTTTEMKEMVLKANTFTGEGRQVVANLCRDLYNLTEVGFFEAGYENSLSGFYERLCYGNFANPYSCERKKKDFVEILKIYTENVLARS